MSKKLIWTIVVVVAIVAITLAVIFLMPGQKNIEGTLAEIMTKIYAEIPNERIPMALDNMPLTEDNVEYYIGTTEVQYKEAIASESMVGSIAHSVVLVRMNDAKEAKAAVEKIKTSVDPRKWICVEASNVAVKSKGDLVILIMSNEDLAPSLEANFDNL